MEKFKFLAKSKLENLPKTSGVYLFYSKNNKTPIYIGKAINIQGRVKNHFYQPSYRDNLFMSLVSRVGFIKTNSEIEALILEANLIKKYQPKYNVVWRDDKNYFYVAIENNEQSIPYVYITHQFKNSKIKNSKIRYIGPFTEGVALKKTLRFLRRAFPYYSVKKHSKLKCTYCHLDLCPGPELFENPPSPKASAHQREYKKNIRKLVLILKGKRNAVLNSLKKEMKQLSKEKEFEKAGKIRDRIHNLQQVMQHTRVIRGNENDEFLPYGKNSYSPDLKTLQKIIGVKKPVLRIEAYDVSNIQGKQATGSMAVFVNGAPEKSQYKKFKIRINQEPNDIAMLKETITRRLKHTEWTYPEVMLIDGGKAQLNVAIKAKKTKKIKIMSIAKGRQELFIEGKLKPIPLKSLPREIYNLIKQLDAEAHRFAILYHKKLRRKNLLK